jgi:hypothetical protein
VRGGGTLALGKAAGEGIVGGGSDSALNAGGGESPSTPRAAGSAASAMAA